MRALLTVLLLSLSAGTIQASLQELQQRLAGLEQLSGSFQQALLSENGEPLESSSGQFSLLRPAFLRWHILEPEEQLLVASGDSFWHYDVELETATRRPIHPGNPTSPMAILSGDSRVLADYYQVEQLDDHSWALTPLFADAEFVSVTLRFDGELPTLMRIHDKLGRSTVIEFGELNTNPGLKPDDFNFAPPAGVDIYSDEP